MESETANASQDERDSDDEEVGGNNRLLGFMFGNVDNSGELDVDYLDEDAKEHLDALADQLGQPLTDMDLSGKLSEPRVTSTEEDYDEKAEDAVDYEDIDEQYEGPEVQASTEEDHLLPKKDYSSSAVFTTGQEHISVFEDDNYDEDEEDEKEHETVPSFVEDQTAGLSEHASHLESNGELKLAHSNLEHEAAISPVVQENDNLQNEEHACEVKDPGMINIPNEAFEVINCNKDDETLKDISDTESTNSLPILCMENGMPILRFSEIFGVFEPLTKIEKREHRYLISRDKFLPPDVSHLVEEDEVEFLRDPSQGYSIVSKEVMDDMSITSDDDAEFANSNSERGCAAIHNEFKRDSCLGAEPMKQDLDIDISLGFPSEMPPKFYPLHYFDWDERIIWGDSPIVNDASAENDDLPGYNSDCATNENNGQANLQCSFKSVEYKNHEGQYFSLPVKMDLNGIGGSERVTDFSYPDCAPSDLDTKSESLNGDSREHSDTRQDNVSERNQQTSFLKRFKQLRVQNKDFDEGSWLEKIIWDPEKPISRSKLIFDLQDDLMIFEISDDSDYKHLQLHAGAMVLTRPAKSAASDYVGQSGLEVLSGGRFNVSNDKFYSTRKASQQLKSVLKKRTAHGVKVWHSIPALKLQTIKPRLSNKEIANFHRPKAVWYPRDNKTAGKELEKLSSQGPMKIILQSLGGKGTKVYVDAEEAVSSLKLKAGKKLDFRPSEAVRIIYSGNELEDDKTLAEQNVLPNSLLHLVRTKIHPFLMAHVIPGEHKSLRPPGAFKKKSDLSVKDGHVFLMEYCEERPLLLGNAGMGARLCTYYPKLSSDDQTVDSLRSAGNNLGTVLTLDPADKSPFLGDIKPGSCQSSIETNMYRAPIFPHKVASTDYLLVRSAKGKLSIRRINRMHVVGQQEPHMEVMSPVAKGLQTYMMNRLLVHIYREFRDAEKRGDVPCIRADVLSTLFPNIAEPLLRKRLKHCADLQKRSNGKLLWVKRRNFHIPSEEELRRMVTPENVCSYESMQAGLNRLKRLGITKLSHLTGPTQLASLSSAMNLLPDEAIALAASSHIERELQITPWNLSSNFVACTSQDRENIERLEITGVGDPSGRGLGFSYVRLAAKPPVATVKKKPVVAKGSTVTGTDADLRRLSMEAAREVLVKFNVPDEQIAKLTRWHRIAMIRKLSSEQTSSGIDMDPMTISKFARGQRMSFLQLQQQTREKCQEIWERQAESLQAADGDEIESDSEANSDLDSFAGDLENLLDAEECEEMEEDDDDMEFKHEKLKMRGHPSQAQLEEENEDEAAEAAELCQLLINDFKADGKKKLKPKPVPGKLSLQPKGHAADTKLKKNIVAKQKIGSSTPSGSFTTKQGNAHVQIETEASKHVIPGTQKEAKTSEPRVKIKAYGGKILKERKSARERFVCGACGQLGHMRTNKNCPKYREDPDAAPVNTTSQEKASEKPNSVDPSSLTEPKPKKLITKTAPKSTPVDAPNPSSQTEPKPKKLIAITAPKPTPVDAPVPSSLTEPKPKKLKTAPKPTSVDAPEGEKINVKPKSLKFKVASNDKTPPEKVTSGPTVSSEQPSTSEAEPGSKPAHSKPSIVIKPPADTVKEQPSSKPSIVIKPPADTVKEHPRKKVVFIRPKESTSSMDQGRSYDGGVDVGFRKTKKIVDLTEGVITNRRQDRNILIGEAVRGKSKENKQRMWEEEERRMAEKQRVETARRIYVEEMRLREEQRLDELRRYEESLRIEREEEERQKAQQKKKKKRKLEPQDDPVEDFRLRRSSNNNNSSRLVPERDRSAKRKSVVELGRYSNESTPATKRRRGGEVGLANILENIVEALRSRVEVSYLFLKPVSKKEAPDYLDIIDRPMDLSTIRDRVRRLEYKNRKEFRHDVWQITYNAHAYNDMRNPGIPPLADQLLEICDYLLDENDMNLTEAEESIDGL